MAKQNSMKLEQDIVKFTYFDKFGEKPIISPQEFKKKMRKMCERYGIRVESCCESTRKLISDIEIQPESIFTDIHPCEWDQMSLREVIEYAMQRKNLTNKDVYKPIYMQPSTFSRIVSGQSKHPTKDNLILIAIGLRLKPRDLEKLLIKGGYSSDLRDERTALIKEFLEREEYDLTTINLELNKRGWKLLEPRRSPNPFAAPRSHIGPSSPEKGT